MAFEKIKKAFKGATIKDGCQIDKGTGRFVCERRRITDDGEETIGKISGGLTAGCDVAPDEVWQSEDGVIDDLNKKFLSQIKGKCSSKNNRPEDY